MSERQGRLVVVSNRLPIAIESDAEGHPKVVPGTGGLVTALSPVLRNRGGLWIGWLGASEAIDEAQVLAEGSRGSGYTLCSVGLTEEEIRAYYYGFSNEVLWFLFHDFISLCNFDPAYWPVYQQVNRKFAEVIARQVQPDDYIWVHDYHLILTGAMLREMGVANRLGFFLHIPFPPVDGFLKLPWRRELLRGLLQYDLIGFQTMRDTTNFLRCVRMLVPGARVESGGSMYILRTSERELRVGTFSIGIDHKNFVQRAANESVVSFCRRIRESLHGAQLILGLDRLDWTKGIPQRITAFGVALEEYPELRRRIDLLQVVVPSRLDVSRYRQLKDEIERLIASINGRFTQPGWTPVHYMFRSLSDWELSAYYRSADIALVTPLKDGMNLIAKEYCASQLDGQGVLILSEFAGAAAQLHRDALVVNPFDIRGMAAAIHHAFNMDLEDRRRRMRRMQRGIQRTNVHRWVDGFLRAAFAVSLEDFRRKDDFVPVYYPAGLDEIPFAAPGADERMFMPPKEDPANMHPEQAHYGS
ncbi:MAG: trehalose-6-phosphate synthase [bacterium]